MNPPRTLLQFSEKEILEMANDAQDGTRERAALLDVVRLRRKNLELKGTVKRLTQEVVSLRRGDLQCSQAAD